MKCGHSPPVKVRNVGPSNQTSNKILTKSFSKKSLETVWAGFKCEISKRQQLMDKSALIYCTCVCINDLYTLLIFCTHA